MAGVRCGASNVVYDVDGRVLQERDDSLRALLGLERQGHLEEAAACRERAARLRGRRGFSAISASARRACYRVLRASDAVSRKCEAADAEGFGYCGTRALDAALRADALVSDAKDREDICEWCAVEGKVDYAALYETLSRVLAEDRRLRKDLDVPAKSSKRLTQDSLAVKYEHRTLRYSRVGSAATASRPTRAGGWSTSTLAIGGRGRRLSQMGVSPSRRSGTSGRSSVIIDILMMATSLGRPAPQEHADIIGVWPAGSRRATSTATTATATTSARRSCPTRSTGWWTRLGRAASATRRTTTATTTTDQLRVLGAATPEKRISRWSTLPADPSNSGAAPSTQRRRSRRKGEAPRGP